MSMGERLKMARARAGLSLRNLAELVEVSPMAISKYERGMAVPGSAILVKMAKVLGVKPEFFFRPTKVMLSQPSFRKKKSLSAKSKKMILGEVQDWLERYMEVESILFEKPSTFQMPKCFSNLISSFEDVEKVAEELRQEWGLGNGPIENLSEVLEERGLKVGLVDGQEGFDALTLRFDNEWPVIVIKRELPGDRRRFNLAHELGHMLKVEEPVGAEKAAHRFAGAFLVPAEAARRELGSRRSRLNLLELHLLKHKYGMSMQAWIYRAKDLGIINEYVYANLFRTFRQRGWHKKEWGEPLLSPEEPERMKRLVMKALAENLITRSRASELLGRPLAEFWKEEATRHGCDPEALYS